MLKSFHSWLRWLKSDKTEPKEPRRGAGLYSLNSWTPPLAFPPPFLIFQPISLNIQNDSPGISPNLAFKISGNKAFTTSLRETIFQPTVLHSKPSTPILSLNVSFLNLTPLKSLTYHQSSPFMPLTSIKYLQIINVSLLSLLIPLYL